jgi:hypothetical protein
MFVFKEPYDTLHSHSFATHLHALRPPLPSYNRLLMHLSAIRLWFYYSNIFEENMSPIFSTEMNQLREVAGHTERKASYKVCMANEGPVGSRGTADPEVANYLNMAGRTVRMCTCKGASTWVVAKHRVQVWATTQHEKRKNVLSLSLFFS